MPKSRRYQIQDRAFLTIVEQSPISTQIFDKNGTTIFVNKAWEDMWCVNPQEILYSYNILQDQQLVEKHVMPLIKKAFQGEKNELPPIYYQPQKTLPHLLHVLDRFIGGVIYPLTNTKKKVTHVVLQQYASSGAGDKDYMHAHGSKEANYRLAALVNSSEDAIISKTLKSIITTWNEGAEKLFEFSAEEAVGQPITIVIPPYLQKEEKEIISRIKNGERISHYRTERMKKDGTILSVSVTVSPIIDDNGHIIGASNITRDTTEQTRIDQEKSDFLSMVSHELKTPLTSMKMFLELLGRFLDPTELDQAKYFVNRVHDQTNQLVELTNDLLDVSRVETGKLRLNIEEFNLDALVRETVEAITTSTRTHKLILQNNIELAIEADRYRIFQVLINLLTNAIKYSPPGKDIFVSVEKNHQNAIVHVQDFGIGISKDHQGKIFDRLYQVNGPKEKTYPGLGLGLYISKEIIKRHKGDIWVKSAKGKGSTFSFTLPLANNSQN